LQLRSNLQGHFIVAAALVASAIVVTLKFVEVKGEQDMLAWDGFASSGLLSCFLNVTRQKIQGNKLKFLQTRSLPSRAETAQHWNSYAMQRTRWP
jgi:hypothetical protein